MERIKLNPGDVEQAQRAGQRAAEVFAGGGLVAFPTETVYGLAASAASESACQNLQRLKRRDEPQPFAVHLTSPEQAADYVDPDNTRLIRAMRKLMPGPVTVIADASEIAIAQHLASCGLHGAVRDQLVHGQTVGLRCPDDAIARAVLEANNVPILATSANRPGEALPVDADQVAASLDGHVQLLIDAGRCKYARPSTVVRVQIGPSGELAARVLREGVWDERVIRRLLRWNLLLVCSGNTCRSPMAEVIARRLLAQDKKLAEEDLETAGFRVLSAGASAYPGDPASEHALHAVAQMGLDLSKHRSRELTAQLVRDADLVLCMTRSHRRAVLQLDEAADGKTFTLDPKGDIEDPFGSDLATYQRCAQTLHEHLQRRLKEHCP
ncbi:MAG: threonylcarbamoyl-AMP synthase [Phycisphaeraceae bacterium]|nr:threonylcarbamoyl-AMP synthase [Phycisphaeraceae bacterium]